MTGRRDEKRPADPASAQRRTDPSLGDDPLVTRIDERHLRSVFVLVEAKADRCDINGPWSNRQSGNMQRVLRRLGFADESLVTQIAEKMYDYARWEDDSYVLQYICVGARKNDGMQRRFPALRQIVWSEMADFFWNRFGNFPENFQMEARCTLSGQTSDESTALGSFGASRSILDYSESERRWAASVRGER